MSALLNGSGKKSGQTGTQKRAFSGFKRFGQNIRDALSTLPRSIRITAFVMADRYIAYPRKQASTPRGKRGRAELYDMDRVLVVEHEGKPALFLDQSRICDCP